MNTTFKIKMPTAAQAAKASALVVTADGAGTITRKRQVENEIVDRQVPVSGVLHESVHALELDGEKVTFDGVDAKAFKVAKGKATGVPKTGRVDVEIPEDFTGTVVVKARKKDGEHELLEAFEVEPKDDDEDDADEATSDE